ncbi:MAG TPA: Uma2 family endonuclease [Streptosporangiaceae bacterium]|jgi:Uma2 family endonuclease
MVAMQHRRKATHAPAPSTTPAPPERDEAEVDPADLLERTWVAVRLAGFRAEVVEGHIIVSPWAARRHAQVVDRLVEQLFDVKRANGWEFYQSWAVHIPPHRGDKRLPDLMVAPPDSPEYDENQAYGDGVLLVTEVVSKFSAEDDFENKPDEYARAGVPLLLVIDSESEKQTVTLFSDPGEHGYANRLTVAAGDPLPLPEPFDLELDTAALLP